MNVKTANEYVVIEKPINGIGTLNTMVLTLEQAKILREQLDDAIDEVHLYKENGEG